MFGYRIGNGNLIDKNGNPYNDDGTIEYIPCFGTCGNSKIIYGKPFTVKCEDLPISIPICIKSEKH